MAGRMRGIAVGVVGVCVGAWGACSASGQISFVERQDLGLTTFSAPISLAIGPSLVDYDGDGDIDVFVPTGLGYPPLLYQNDGTGSFTDVTVAAGLENVKSNDRVGLFIDYDGDRDLDLLIGNDQRLEFAIIGSYPWENTLRLFRQDDGVFTEVTATAGLGGVLTDTGSGPSAIRHLGGLSAGDLDGDGDVDVYLGIWSGPQFLFENTGGAFVDTAGAGGPGGGAFVNDWQPVIWDIDEDGLLDMFCAIDVTPNLAWINQGGMQFSNDSAPLGLDNAWNEMGVTVADYDNDGDLDVYVTNIHDAAGTFPAYSSTHNLLLRNNGAAASPRFEDVAVAAGCAYGDWGWGCDFADFDLDGWTDIIATNGYTAPNYDVDTTKLFHNQGGSPVVFSEVGASAGVDDNDIASGLVSADFDRDGDLDYVQLTHAGTVRYMENTTPRNGNRWLVVRPRRYDGLDHFSIGATVHVEASGQTMTRVITAGTSILSQKPYEAHFGLGTAAKIDRVEVRWPDGKKRVILNDTRLDSVVTIVPAEPGADTYDAALDDVPLGGYTGRRIAPDPREYPERD